MILKTSQMLNLNMELLDHYIGSLKNFLEKCVPFSPIIIGEKLLEKGYVGKSFKEFHNLNRLSSVSLLSAFSTSIVIQAPGILLRW